MAENHTGLEAGFRRAGEVRNLYAILGVSGDASQEDIKRAYRALSHKFHPDKPGGDAESFREVQTAYDILSIPEKRKAYDLGGTPESAAEGLTRIETLLMQSFRVILDEVARSRGRRMDPADVITTARKSVLDAIEEKSREIHECEAQADYLSHRQGHFSRRGENGTNIFRLIIEEKKQALALQIEACRMDIEDGHAMLEYLSEYEYMGPGKLPRHPLQPMEPRRAIYQ